MNVFDFDKTIYNGDSSLDFFLFCLKRQPRIIRALPSQLFSSLKYFLKMIDKTSWKEGFFSFLQFLNNIDQCLIDFWKVKENSFNKNIIQYIKANDIVISASPEFLLKIPCNKFNVVLIATKINKHTGQIYGANCVGEEKVFRFKELYPDEIIQDFFSDSLSDTPLAKISTRSYLVKKNTIQRWP